jgi:hypothetical protein
MDFDTSLYHFAGAYRALDSLVSTLAAPMPMEFNSFLNKCFPSFFIFNLNLEETRSAKERVSTFLYTFFLKHADYPAFLKACYFIVKDS